MIRGPVEYVPPVEVEVVTKRTALPLDENEGIYVRDVKTGKVRAITGETYMLNQDEELWEKELPPTVENLLTSEKDTVADRGDYNKGRGANKGRDKTRVITFRVPHNAAVQIYDYKEKAARYVRRFRWIRVKFVREDDPHMNVLLSMPYTYKYTGVIDTRLFVDIGFWRHTF